MKRVYLAGPDVFFPNVNEIAGKLKECCFEFDLEGVFPLDSEVDLDQPINQQKNGYKIYRGNINLIKSCSAVLANISPFRGPSIDPGTAFEIGYGKSLGLTCVGYTNNLTKLKNRVIPDGLLVEDFQMIDNLMIHAALDGNIFNTSEEAIEYLSSIL